MMPTIHGNGTPASYLEEVNFAALEAIQAAIGSVCLTAPNGRDYYPQGPEAINKAVSEHSARIKALEGMRDYFESVVLHIQDQGAAK